MILYIAFGRIIDEEIQEKNKWVIDLPYIRTLKARTVILLLFTLVDLIRGAGSCW